MRRNKDWSQTENVRAELLARMEEFGKNIAPVPFSEFIELRGNQPKWVVIAHVKVPGVTEFDIEGEGTRLEDALRSVYLALGGEGRILAEAQRSNLKFGVAV